jgi:hypothetical protein
MRNQSWVAVVALSSSVFACSTADSDVERSTEQAQISDIASMAKRPDGRFNVVCTDGRTQIVTAADIAANRVCESTTPPPDPGPGVIVYGNSDSCSDSSATARFTARTDCSTLSETDPVWSLKKDGVCINVNDTNLRGVPGTSARIRDAHARLHELGLVRRGGHG